MTSHDDLIARAEAVADLIEKLAFDLPPPNTTTPQLVSASIFIRDLTAATKECREQTIEECAKVADQEYRWRVNDTEDHPDYMVAERIADSIRALIEQEKQRG